MLKDKVVHSILESLIHITAEKGRPVNQMEAKNAYESKSNCSVDDRDWLAWMVEFHKSSYIAAEILPKDAAGVAHVQRIDIKPEGRRFCQQFRQRRENIRLLIAGTILVPVGLFVLSRWFPEQAVREVPQVIPQTPVLTHQEELLLQLVQSYQTKFEVEKLVVGRDGRIHFDKSEQLDGEYNLATELFADGVEDGNAKGRGDRLEVLIEHIPSQYLRKHSETRWGSPFVVSVTEDGEGYLRNHDAEGVTVQDRADPSVRWNLFIEDGELGYESVEKE